MLTLYIHSIVDEKEKLKKKWWHFLLGVLAMFFGSLFFYCYIGKDDLVFFLKNNRAGYQFVGLKFQLLVITRYAVLSILVFQAIYYSVAFIKIPKIYNQKLKNEFSNIDNFSIDWINKFNLCFGICGLFAFVFYTFTPLKGYHELLIEFVFFVFSAFLCTMGIISLKQQKPVVNLDEINIFDCKLSNKTKFNDKRLVNELRNYMEKEQAYLQQDISLTKVSRKLGTNRSYLSTIINQQFGMNFNAYINQYRVKYVTDYLDKNPTILKEELVLLGGFGSKSTMNRALNKMKKL